ncbi:MAG: hypothetical protein M1820_004610 [Bogoriella megaspora]|nr:MAG: hypothetical protein M1820_004610 [Bogoriella megaspora]
MAPTQEELSKVQETSGGENAGRAAAARSTGPADKLESDLEINKSNKTTTDSADQVAGRQGKGTATGLLEKLVPGKETK